MTYDMIAEAFTEGDCWALALEMHRRFDNLTVCTLIDPYWSGDDGCYDYMEWVHVVVKDNDTGKYYDVLGEHTRVDQSKWSRFHYTDIYEIANEDLRTYFTDEISGKTERYYPNISVDAGITRSGIERTRGA